MKKIKVNFHVNTFLYGGLEKILLTYLKHLSRDKYDISLTIGRNLSDLQTLISEIPKDVNYSYLVESPIINKGHYLKRQRKKLNPVQRLLHNLLFRSLGEYLYKRNFTKKSKYYDVIIDFDFYSEPLISDIPIVGVLHFSLQSFLEWKLDNTSPKYAELKTKFASYAAFILLNDEMKAECDKVYPEFTHKYNVIYNPFDLIKITQMSEGPLVNDFGDYIITVCRLNESQKDVTTLIKSFKILREEFNFNGNLLIIGDGPSQLELADLANVLGISKFVKFLGVQSNPFVFVKHAKVFVLSSKFEGLPSVVIESIVIGTPVVSSDCPTGAREILLDGKYGELVPIGDSVQMAQSIHKLLTESDYVAELKQAMLVRRNDFSIECAMEKFDALINKLCVSNN